MLALVKLLPFVVLASATPLAKRYAGVQIVSDVDGKCLAATPKTGSGSAVTTVNCGQTNFPEIWDISPGSGSVTLHGTNLALDAGLSPTDHGLLKVWTSYPGLYQQTWYLTPDYRIAITGGTQCLDEGVNGPQIYTCTTGNKNQAWTIRIIDSSPTSTYISTSDTVYTTSTGYSSGPVSTSTAYSSGPVSASSTYTSGPVPSSSEYSSGPVPASSAYSSGPVSASSGFASSTDYASSGVATSTEYASSGVASSTEYASSGTDSGTVYPSSDIQSGTGYASSGIASGTGYASSGAVSSTGYASTDAASSTEYASSGIASSTEYASSGVISATSYPSSSAV